MTCLAVEIWRVAPVMLCQCVAYDLSWHNGQRHISLSNLRRAYDDTEYEVSRQQAETMLLPHTRKSTEYECPFPLPKVAAAELISAQDRERSRKIMASIQRDSLLQSEKKTLSIAKPAKAKKAPKRQKITADELRQANLRRLNWES